MIGCHRWSLLKTVLVNCGMMPGNYQPYWMKVLAGKKRRQTIEISLLYTFLKAAHIKSGFARNRHLLEKYILVSKIQLSRTSQSLSFQRYVEKLDHINSKFVFQDKGDYSISINLNGMIVLSFVVEAPVFRRAVYLNRRRDRLLDTPQTFIILSMSSCQLPSVIVPPKFIILSMSSCQLPSVIVPPKFIILSVSSYQSCATISSF